ncbi:MAG: DNA gyrase subunit A [Vicingaceae bacterium]|nr:MAG: DNA gyrase subunit A [Vicingaceae bacterium]
MSDKEKIISVNIENEMKQAYIDYSMSVIVSRALPDVRDGLKPVHRRILYAMNELGLRHDKPYKKSARIVGEVLGKYHPHGDSAVYDAMVRMAQEWSMRYLLVDGQGNFGSIDGDSPAAMRYTEARLQKIAEEMLMDIDKETVDFTNNFDDTLKEPTVLPSRIPNLLMNGASGIAVGMATNMAPHNLSELIDGIVQYIDNNDITIDELMQYIKAPDFPTGGIIYGYEGVKQAFHEGRGRVIIRGKAEIEVDENGREQIIVTEIPYMVNKAEMIKKIADLVNDKKIEGISDIRDESDRNGLRVVFELKRDANAKVVLNNLYKHSQLQSAFNINNIALSKGRPVQLNLKDLIREFVDFRHEVVERRTKYELKKAQERAHILEGLKIAVENIDEVIKIIRSSYEVSEARQGLMERFELTEIQANAILDMRLQKLTGLQIEDLIKELENLRKLIAELESILASKEKRMQIIKDELIEIKNKYGDERRSVIEYNSDEFSIEDMIPDDDMVITISHLGYIKRTPLAEYRRQSRGGVGSKASATRDEDFLEHLFVASAHNYLLIFTQKGKCYWMRVFEIPEGQKNTKGRAIQNLIQIDQDDKVMAYINVKDIKDKEYIENNYLVMCTKKGIIKKTPLEQFSRPRSNGIIAVNVREGDELIEVKLTGGKDEIMIALKSGKAIRFPESKVRPVGRNAIGVKGVTLSDEQDEVVGMITISNPLEETVLVVSEKGYGKRSFLKDPATGEEIYRITNRGGKGVKTINITKKTGKLIAIKAVTDKDDLMIITRNGLLIRMPVKEIRVMGRAAQGVKLINLKNNDEIAAVAKVENEDDFENNEVKDMENIIQSPDEGMNGMDIDTNNENLNHEE